MQKLRYGTEPPENIPLAHFVDSDSGTPLGSALVLAGPAPTTAARMRPLPVAAKRIRLPRWVSGAVVAVVPSRQDS